MVARKRLEKKQSICCGGKMPVNGARQANLLDKGALGALATPTRRRRGSFTGSAVVRQEGESAKTPCKTDVINCICGKNRESAAKD